MDGSTENMPHVQLVQTFVVAIFELKFKLSLFSKRRESFGTKLTWNFTRKILLPEECKTNWHTSLNFARIHRPTLPFNRELIDSWVEEKMKEVIAVRNRPHPFEMNLYYSL